MDVAMTLRSAAFRRTHQLAKEIRELSERYRPRRGKGPGGSPALPHDFASYPDYPRPWWYGGHNGQGGPIFVSGAWNETYLQAIARFSLVTLKVTPFADGGYSVPREIVTKLRAYNPNCRVLWYDTFSDRFVYLTAGTMFKAEWDLYIATPSAVLYCLDGTRFPYNGTLDGFVDVGQVKEGTLAAWQTYAVNDGGQNADGFYFDFASGTVSGNSANGSPLDLARAGYATAAELDASASTGLDYVGTALGAIKPVFGNGYGVGPTHDKSKWTGELFEGWDPDNGAPFGGAPPLNYASFDAAMAALATWRRDGIDGGGTGLVKCENFGPPYTAAWNKCARFALGSATIQGGYGFVGPSQDETYTPFFALQWPDEYSVTPIAQGGAHDPTATYQGWLGRPVELPVKDSISGIYVRRFTKGAVVVNGQTSPHTINMGTPYRRIAGLHDTAVNNGATEQNVTVPAKDAVFLLSI
jgi:hypothetical protein